MRVVDASPLLPQQIHILLRIQAHSRVSLLKSRIFGENKSYRSVEYNLMWAHKARWMETWSGVARGRQNPQTNADSLSSKSPWYTSNQFAEPPPLTASTSVPTLEVHLHSSPQVTEHYRVTSPRCRVRSGLDQMGQISGMVLACLVRVRGHGLPSDVVTKVRFSWTYGCSQPGC